MFTKLEKEILNATDSEYKYIYRDCGFLYLTTEIESRNIINFPFDHIFKSVKNGAEPICFRKQILDDSEREYLKAVFKPFAKRINYVTKIKDWRFGNYIWVQLGDVDSLNFPYFNDNKNMYRGMEFDKHYTLEELGIIYGD